MSNKEILTPEEQQHYLCNAIQQQGNHSSEKEIETELYALLLNYFQRHMRSSGILALTSYTNPHNIDGLLTISTTETTQRLLIETKTQRSLKATGVWAPLGQALQYTHLLQSLGELLPGAILIATEQEWHAVQVDSLAPLLSRSDLPWETVPSERSPAIEVALQELSPAILSYTLDAALNLNDALESITAFLHDSKNRSVKHHGDCSQQGVSLELDPTTHSYHAPKQQWWIYREQSGIWEAVEQREIALELREQAERDGILSRSINTLIKAAIEEGKVICTVDQWTSPSRILNTPQGSWNIDLNEFQSTSPGHGYRHCTGVVEPCGSSTSSPSSPLSKVVSRALRVAAGLAQSEVIYCITPGEEEVKPVLDVLSRALGSYACQGDSYFITSQWKWDLERGDAPILLVDGAAEHGRLSSMERGLLSRERLDGAAMLVILSEKIYEGIKRSNTQDSRVSTTWIDKIELTPAVLLHQGLKLTGDQVEIESYDNDLMLSWFNGHVEERLNHYVLLQDAFESFNEFLDMKGKAAVSYRYFTASFTDRLAFLESMITYEQRKRVKAYTQSQRKNKDGKITLPSEHNNVFMNMAFSS